MENTYQLTEAQRRTLEALNDGKWHNIGKYYGKHTIRLQDIEELVQMGYVQRTPTTCKITMEGYLAINRFPLELKPSFQAYDSARNILIVIEYAGPGEWWWKAEDGYPYVHSEMTHGGKFASFRDAKESAARWYVQRTGIEWPESEDPTGPVPTNEIVARLMEMEDLRTLTPREAEKRIPELVRKSVYTWYRYKKEAIRLLDLQAKADQD